MILSDLVTYYETLADKDLISKLGYSKAKVTYAIELSPAGEIRQFVPLESNEENTGKKAKKRTECSVPEQVSRSSGVKPNFLCDHSGYMLGMDLKGKPQRSLECFSACRDLTLSILQGTEGMAATAIKTFFQTWNPENEDNRVILGDNCDDILSGGNLIFQVDGMLSIKDKEILEAWERHLEQKEEAQSSPCLVTGKKAPIARIHPNIKGVLGAKSVGANIVSFNADSYESFGKEQGYNAPISEYAAFAYTTALNHLLSSQDNRQIIGDMTVVFWSETAEKEYADLFSIALNSDGNEDALLQDIFVKVALGKPIDQVDLKSKFYVLGLSPNSSRISIRFFLKDNFGTILSNIWKHQERLEIIKSRFNHKYISLYRLLQETVNQNTKDKKTSPVMAGAMLRSILQGTKYPQAFYNGLLIRAKAEQEISSIRAAGIKAFLMNSAYKAKEEVLTVNLNENTDNKAYVLGRLFAVLERAQEEANPGINSTIKDRYFSSASATPAIVFPRLLRLSNFHNAKSEYGKNREIEIGKIMDKLNVLDDPFPSNQSLQEQGYFMLGYYQQREQRYVKKEDKVQEKE